MRAIAGAACEGGPTEAVVDAKYLTVAILVLVETSAAVDGSCN